MSPLDYFLSCSSWGMKSPICLPFKFCLFLCVVHNIWQFGHCGMLLWIIFVCLDGTLWVRCSWIVFDLFSNDGFLTSGEGCEFGLYICGRGKTWVFHFALLTLTPSSGLLCVAFIYPRQPFILYFIALCWCFISSFYLMHRLEISLWYHIHWVCSPWFRG